MQAASAAANALVRANKKETIMRMPEILQGEARTRFLQGIAFGAVAAITIGFMWGGWVTGGTAKTMTAMAESNGRMSVLVPICVAQFTAVDGAIFYDAGRVAPRFGDLGFDGLESDYGIGFRFGTRNGVFLRVEGAFGSSGGKHFILRYGHVF